MSTTATHETRIDFKPLHGVSGPLYWEQPKAARREYTLRAGPDTVGMLSFRSALGSMAEVTTATGHWTFKRMGFFRTRVVVRAFGKKGDLAEYSPRWTGTAGEIRVPGFAAYKWLEEGAFSSTVELRDAEGLMLRYSSDSEHKTNGVLRTEARVDIEPRALKDTNLPMLLMLGWYLLILHNEDINAVTVMGGV